MNANSRVGANPESEFDQAVIAYLQETNPTIAKWTEETLLKEHTLATIIDMEESELDPDDDATVELLATAIELWVIEVGIVSPTTSVTSSKPENSPREV